MGQLAGLYCQVPEGTEMMPDGVYCLTAFIALKRVYCLTACIALKRSLEPSAVYINVTK